MASPQSEYARRLEGRRSEIRRLKRRDGRLAGALLQVREAEREVGSIAQRSLLVGLRRHRPDGLEQSPSILGGAGTDHRDAEIEPRVWRPVVVARLLQRAHGLAEATLRHQHVRGKQSALRLERARQRRANALEAAPCLGVVAALVADASQVEVRAVADRLRYRSGQQPVEDPRGLGVQSQRKVEAARKQLGFRRVMLDPVQVARHLEAHQRVEIIVLEKVEQHVAVIEVANLAGGRQVPRCILRMTGAHATGEHAGDTDQRPATVTRSAHGSASRGPYSHWRTTNSGCSAACRSLMRSSRYLAPTALSNLSVVPRR